MPKKIMFEVKCTDYGKTAMVPFKPTPGKPVYCKTCFSKHIFKRPESGSKNSSFDSKQAWSRRGDGWRGRKEKPANVFKKV
jgi:CxxC-x17-CxxC domain-containing protein